ncbi:MULTISPECIES: periplasmic heavy metal sensor [unclassified Ruegeria]|uniref:periplasmic heavy metal sensor n=1 Tax=unclassified Ruegeria TaxID=2625375 RepID=UPI001489DBA5|nr:periplasmic heavy metal sensor [Ruegeria sp. HKCCD8929]
MSDANPKKRRWPRILLGVSLALNLLVIGLVAGTVLRFRGDGRHPPAFGPALYRALPDADRKALHGELRGRHDGGSKSRGEDFRALAEALRAVPFEPGAVEAVIEAQAQARAEVHKSLNQAWLARVSDMSDTERADYADRLEEVVRKGDRRRRHRD